ncbi:MAG: YigZ family protein [Bacilli bacterium]|nr:YigZ family protein [Bacilli bacterium]
MKTIKQDVINEIIINKSKFITVLTNINDTNELNEKIKFYKNKYKDATHYCTAYIINSYMKCDDDGEPAGTAGMPILNVLKNNELTNTLCLVIRYFGGIKLGAGGLIRAYSKSASQALSKASITKLIEGYLINIEFDYENTKKIDSILKDETIKKVFGQKVIYTFKISSKEFNNIENIISKYAKIIKKEPILLTV